MRELCTIKTVLLCWSTSGRPQLQLRAHMAFNAEHSKLPLSGAWQRRRRGGEKSQTEAYVTPRQAGDKRYKVQKSQWLRQLAFSTWYTNVLPSFFLKNISDNRTNTCTIELFAANAFLPLQKVNDFPSSMSAIYLSLCCGPQHTGQHSSLTSGSLSIPNLSGHIPHCCFDV